MDEEELTKCGVIFIKYFHDNQINLSDAISILLSSFCNICADHNIQPDHLKEILQGSLEFYKECWEQSVDKNI